MIEKKPEKCVFCDAKNEEIALIRSVLRDLYPAKIYQCDKCSIVFLYPRLTEEEQKRYYSVAYREDYKDDPIEKRYVTDMFEAKMRMRRILEQFHGVRSLLEVGSGSGAFLSLAHDQFDNVAGIELDINARKFLKDKGLAVFSDVEALEDEKFDLIVLFHVFEHLLDPILFLESIKRKLHKGGHIILEVPNVQDSLLSFYSIEEFRNFYFCSAHVNYFSEKTLTGCAKSAGMNGEITQIQRYDLHNHIHWLKYGKPGTLMGEHRIFSDLTLKSYEKDLISNRIADTLWGVFRVDN